MHGVPDGVLRQQAVLCRRVVRFNGVLLHKML